MRVHYKKNNATDKTCGCLCDIQNNIKVNLRKVVRQNIYKHNDFYFLGVDITCNL